MRYSNDLRKKVVDLVQNGTQQKEVADLLKIDKFTVYRWNKRYNDTGTANYLSNYETGRKSKISPLEYDKLQEFITANNRLSIHDMACKLGNISRSAFQRTIYKMGYTFKKSHGYIKKEERRKKERRNIEIIMNLLQSVIFYLDESGFDIDMQQQGKRVWVEFKRKKTPWRKKWQS
jgi:transposase